MSQMNALPDDAIWLATYDTSDGDYGRDNESLYYLPESSSFAVEYYPLIAASPLNVPTS